MRILFLILLYSVAHGQPGNYSADVFVKNGGSIQVGAIKYLPPAGGTSTRKPPICIYLHGIDQVYAGAANGGRWDTTGAYGSANATAGIKGAKWLVSKSIPFSVYIKAYPLYPTPFGTERFALYAPQCKSGEDWEVNILIGAVNRIIATMGSIVDTNRIWVFGYSLGGIGAKLIGANAYLRSKCSYIFILSPGPTNTPDYAGFAASGIQTDIVWNKEDQVALPSYGWCAPFVQALNAANPVAPVQYFEIVGTNPTWYGSNKHDMWLLINDSLATFAPTLSSGNVWQRGKYWPFARAAGFTRQRPHR